MEPTYRKPAVRAGLGALVALLVLLIGTGNCVASAGEQAGVAKLAQTAPLAQGAGYDAGADARRVRVLQRMLRRQGWAPGPVDGLFGPRTEAALVRFQQATGLAADGIAGPAVWTTLAQADRNPLRRGAGYQTAAGSERVRALQRRLRDAGLNPGPVDGRYGPRTEAAVARLQRSEGLKASGAVDARTRRVLAPGPQTEPKKPAVDNRVKANPNQALDRLAVAPLAGADASDGADVSLWLAILIAALTLLLGALCGALIARNRGRSRTPTRAEADDEAVEPPALTPEPAKEEPKEGTVTSDAPRQPVRAVGYVSVPKHNGEDAHVLGEQADAIHRLCERRGWELLHVVRDVENGHAKGLERPGLLYALERIAEGEASCLVVSELGRLSRSAADLGRIVEWFDERDARLVAIDVRLDTGSAQGRLTARTLVAVGEWEGRRIAEQTKKGLAAARARRASAGRPAVEDQPALKQRIVEMRNEGMTLQAIADQLNAEGVPTLRGGAEWRPSSVQAAAGYRRPKNKRSKVRERPNGEPQ